MGKVYHINNGDQSRAEYRETVHGILSALREYSDTIFNNAVDLAFSGVWKEWTDEQASGDEVRITEEMLLQCGDMNVKHLVELVREIDSVIEDLEKKVPD